MVTGDQHWDQAQAGHERVFVGGHEERAALLLRRRKYLRLAGHEFRNALTGCHGHLELMARAAGGSSSALSLVLDELTRMGRVVEDLQALEESSLPDFVCPETVDLPALMSQIAEGAARLAQDRRWVFDIPVGGTVPADRHRIAQAGANLARNAVQHTEPRDTLVLGAALSGDEWRLWLQDEGPGVSPEVQERAVEPFYRGPESRRRYQGAGLGLAVVHVVAAAHGGRLRVDSDPGHGAFFEMVLPTRPPVASAT